MNLVETLLKGDAKKASEKKTGIFKSARLAEISGVKGKIDVEIRELTQRQIRRNLGTAIDKEGNPILERSTDAEALIAVQGVVNPDLHDQRLREYYGCSSPKDLAEKLFGRELSALADKIQELSEYDEEAETEAIKN